jgi:hypothetical protein
MIDKAEKSISKDWQAIYDEAKDQDAGEPSEDVKTVKPFNPVMLGKSNLSDRDDEYPFAGMSLDQAADLASRHGHDREEAKRKINNRPSSWIPALKDWKAQEKAGKDESARDKRKANWAPSEIQYEILKIIGTGKKFHKTQDMLTYSKYRNAMQSLVKRGVIDRVDTASEIHYKPAPQAKA